MRFAQAHKTTSYLTMATALCAMASGGGLGPIVTLVAVLGLVGSWFWEAPRVDVARWAWVFTVLAVLAMVWAGVAAITTGDYLGAGGGFLALVTVARACTRRAARDWQQLYLLSFLMLVAGSVLNADVTYAVCFLLFVISATWTLILFHLRREMEDNFLLKHADPRASERVEIQRILASKRIVDRRFFVGTGLVSLGVFVLAGAMFLAIPRIGVGFFFRGKGGLELVGFSDGVKLGGHGRLKSDPTIVMRVEVGDSRLRGRRANAMYWRGSSFDLYQHGEWTRSRRAPASDLSIERLTKTRERRYWRWPLRAYGDARLDELRADSVYQDIYLDPIGADVLFAATSPAAVEVDVPFRGHRPSDERNDEVRLRHEGPLHYRAWSRLEQPSAEALAAAPTAMRKDYEAYLQLPPEITQRTRDLAAEITRGATSNYERASRIRDWLIANNRYSLELVDPGKQEPIDFFLFDRKAGHCEYFASAFAVLARAVGVPTRNVNGFLGGEWNEYDDYIAVRAGDAHSWSEVYFPGQGWVIFDATPPGMADELGRGGTGWRAKLRRWFDSLRFQWNKWVVDYDLYQQLELFRSIGKKFSGGARSMKAMASAVKRWTVRHAVVLAIVVGAALVAVAVWLRRKRKRWWPGPARERARVRSELAALYDRAAKRMARRGYRRDPAITPRELARDLVQRGVDGAGELAELTELYYAAEWGRDVTDAMLVRARELATAIDLAGARTRVA